MFFADACLRPAFAYDAATAFFTLAGLLLLPLRRMAVFRYDDMAPIRAAPCVTANILLYLPLYGDVTIAFFSFDTDAAATMLLFSPSAPSIVFD